MKSSEASEILQLLVAGFHRESLEPATIELWLELITPYDAEAAVKVALSWIKTQDRFPTINQFRHAYHSQLSSQRIRSIDAPVSTNAMGVPTKDMPGWVVRWRRSREAVPVDRDGRFLVEKGDMRVFPEQIADGPKYHDDPRYTLAEADEIGIMPEDAWA